MTPCHISFGTLMYTRFLVQESPIPKIFIAGLQGPDDCEVTLVSEFSQVRDGLDEGKACRQARVVYPLTQSCSESVGAGIRSSGYSD